MKNNYFVGLEKPNKPVESILITCLDEGFESPPLPQMRGRIKLNDRLQTKLIGFHGED